MELILLKPVKSLGNEGDVIKVKDGYARNFLIPQRIAQPVTMVDVRMKESLLKKGEIRRLKELEDLKEVAQALASLEVEIKVKSGKGGRMFGSVTNLDIAKAIEEKGIPVDRKKIMIEQPIKNLGAYEVPIKLHRDLDKILIKIQVVSDIEEIAADIEEDEETEESYESYEESSEITEEINSEENVSE